MNEMIFAFLAIPGRSDREVTMLTDSIRTFGGAYSGNPIWLLVPSSPENEDAAKRLETALRPFHVNFVPFEIDEVASQFPFAAKVFAAAVAEAQAVGQTNNLAWMDSDTIVIQEPTLLLLKEGKRLGYRPVDHTLIGSIYDEPVDPFWQLIYDHCEVAESSIFPMRTSVDERVLRAYFNAGMLVVRPELGILRLWAEKFNSLYRQKTVELFFQQDKLYQIFLHQAVLAGAILSRIQRGDLQELPYQINYPMHMNTQYPGQPRPRYMNDLITGRHDTLFQDPAWEETLPVRDPLRRWLIRRLKL